MMMVPRKNGFNIFDEVFNDPFFTKKENKLMKTDVREKDGNYVLEIDLPGYNKEDIRIDLTDGYFHLFQEIDCINETDHSSEIILFVGYNFRCFQDFLYIGWIAPSRAFYK